MIKATVKYSGPGFRAYIPKLEHATEDGPAEAAAFLADAWRANAHVITGSYVASIYTQTHDGSTYGAAAQAARALNPAAEIVPELPKPARKGAAAVGSAVRHSLYEELGTSRRPAHPAFVPAVEKARRQFPEIMRRRLRP